MGARDQMANEVEAVLRAHPDVIDVVVGSIRDGSLVRYGMHALVRSNLILAEDLAQHCKQHPKTTGWFSQFARWRIDSLDGPCPLDDDEQEQFENYLEVRNSLPPGNKPFGPEQDGKIVRSLDTVQHFLESGECERLTKTGARYKRLREGLEDVKKTLEFLSPELQGLGQLDPASHADLDAFAKTGLVAQAADEVMIAMPKAQARDQQRAQAERLNPWRELIAKMEQHFSNVHNYVTSTVWPIDENGPKIGFKVVVGRMTPKEATIWQYAYIAHSAGALDREGHNSCLKAALAKHPWDFEPQWNPVSPTDMEAKAGMIALYKQSLAAENIDVDYGMLVNMIQKIAKEQPQHPIVGWFQRRTGGGGGWATSR